MSGRVQGPPHVVCDVCGNREVAALVLGPGYIACECRDTPEGDKPDGAAVRYRWSPTSDQGATVRVWCSVGRDGHWLAFSKRDAIAAAKKRGVVRAYPDTPA